ncbi:unnamed protein product [Calicophoron daubneyi]|uniref:Uncharacterized protein n=1 Tax=Calicophoron daubneyi TaxID=300641 RepID=A0AAV2TDC7_CALDB
MDMSLLRLVSVGGKMQSQRAAVRCVTRLFSSVPPPTSQKNKAEEIIKPEPTASQRQNITACCAIEISTDRLSFAKMHLNKPECDRLTLDVWDSLPLKLPGGKEFKPHLCMPILASVLPELVSKVFDTQSVSDYPPALVIGSMPMVKWGSLVYSGLFGYIIGSLWRKSKELRKDNAPLHVFGVNWLRRQQLLLPWEPCTLKYDEDGAVAALDRLFKLLPKIDIARDSPAYLEYARLLTPLPTDPAVSRKAYVSLGSWTIHTNQLMLITVLANAYLFMSYGTRMQGG